MSKVTFKSLEDMQQFSYSGSKLCEDINGKICAMMLYLRESRCLTTLDVSNATGLQVATIKLIESGRKKLKWSQIARLMRYYGVWAEIKFISQPQEIRLDELLK